MKTRIEITINGTTYTDFEELSVSYGIDQIAGRINARTQNKRSSWAHNQPFEAWGGSEDSAGLLGRGMIVQFQDSYTKDACKNPVVVVGANNGIRMQYPYQGDTGGADKDYAGQTDQAIIQNIVESMGVPSSLTSIEGMSRVFGTLAPVMWRNGEAGWQLIEKIDGATGYRTFCGRDNVIRRLPWSGIPTLSAAYDLQEGGNLRSINRTSGVEGMYNRVIVTGLATEDTEVQAIREAPNDLVPNPPGYLTYTYNNDLIETVPHADERAQYLLNEYNRLNKTYEATCDGIATMTPGVTVTVTSARLGMTAESFYVAHVDQRVTRNKAGEGDFETRLVLIGGYESDIVIEPLPPTAMLALSVFKEYIDGIGPIAVIIADGSASYAPSGTIVSYAWTATPDATPDAATTTTPFFSTYVAASTPSVTITLEVTDSNGSTGTATQTVTIVMEELPAETIWLASGSVARATLDGGETWKSLAGPGGSIRVLAPLGSSWGMLFGTDAGWLLTSEDYLVTSWTTQTQPHGAVACTAVWITEQAEDTLWAAFADGAVYTSQDRGTTWEARGSIPGSGDVTAIQEGEGGSGILNATRGDTVWISTDGGVQWDARRVVGGTTTRLAFGFSHDFVGSTGATPLVQDIETGTGPTLPSLSPAVTAVRGLTLGWKTARLVLADDEGRVLATDGTFAALTQIGWTNGIANHMVRSGNEEGIFYAATDQGFEKSVDGGATWFVSAFPAEEQYMIGYGSSATPQPAPGFLLMGLSNRIAANGVLAQYDSLTGWSKITGPTAFGSHEVFVERLAVNPFNPDQWLVLFGLTTHQWDATRMNYIAGIDISPLWMTLDAGQTWIEVDVPRPSACIYPVQAYGPYPEWSESVDGEWVAGTQINTGSDQYSFVFAGTTTIQSTGPYPGTYITGEIYSGASLALYGTLYPFPGVGNEWFGFSQAGLGLVTFTAADSTFTPHPTGLNGFSEQAQHYPGNDRRVVGGRSGSRYIYFSDYRDGSTKSEYALPGETLSVYATPYGIFTVCNADFGEIINPGTGGTVFVENNPAGEDATLFFGIALEPKNRRYLAIADQHGQHVFLYDAQEGTFTPVPDCDVDVGEVTEEPRGASLWLRGEGL